MWLSKKITRLFEPMLAFALVNPNASNTLPSVTLKMSPSRVSSDCQRSGSLSDAGAIRRGPFEKPGFVRGATRDDAAIESLESRD